MFATNHTASPKAITTFSGGNQRWKSDGRLDESFDAGDFSQNRTQSSRNALASSYFDDCRNRGLAICDWWIIRGLARKVRCRTHSHSDKKKTSVASGSNTRFGDCFRFRSASPPTETQIRCDSAVFLPSFCWVPAFARLPGTLRKHSRVLIPGYVSSLNPFDRWASAAPVSVLLRFGRISVRLSGSSRSLFHPSIHVHSAAWMTIRRTTARREWPTLPSHVAGSTPKGAPHSFERTEPPTAGRPILCQIRVHPTIPNLRSIVRLHVSGVSITVPILQRDSRDPADEEWSTRRTKDSGAQRVSCVSAEKFRPGKCKIGNSPAGPCWQDSRNRSSVNRCRFRA